VKGKGDPGLLLGKHTPVVAEYAPELLYPMARAEGRAKLSPSGDFSWYGADLWHAYELSWLNAAGVPQVGVGRILVPANSPCIIESKSLKLYLNSLNATRFDSAAQLADTIERDLGRVADAVVGLTLLGVESPDLAGATLCGTCIDAAPVGDIPDAPGAELLHVNEDVAEQRLYSNLLRSLCPVTGQPDWATVWLDYRGPELDIPALLRYLLSFRNHQDFHEQCLERMFTDIMSVARPEHLSMQAFYTRRGGLDINPFRSTDPAAMPLPRLNRQ
jgi:7-cyano-7-deazaguanine reductase